MATRIKFAGTYKGMVIDTAFGVTKNLQMPEFRVRLFLTEYYDVEAKEWFDVSDEKFTVTGYMTLFGRPGGKEGADVCPTRNHKQICEVFGWDGRGFEYLIETDFASTNLEVQARIELDEYNGEPQAKVKWINGADADPNPGLTGMDKKEALALESQFAHLFTKPDKATPKKVVAKVSAKPKKETEEDDGDATESSSKKELTPAQKKKKAEMLAKSKRIRDEQKKSEEAKAAAPPKKVKPNKGEYDKRAAWIACIEGKDADATDDILTTSWNAAVSEIAEDGDEDNLDSDGWQKVASQVLGEIGKD